MSDERAVRVVLPQHLQTLARCSREVELVIRGQPTQAAVLDALEARYPMLRGTIREHGSLKRRPRLRFFASGRDVTHDAADEPLPPAVAAGDEPFMIVGAVAGG